MSVENRKSADVFNPSGRVLSKKGQRMQSKADQQVRIEKRDDYLFITLLPYSSVGEFKSEISRIREALISNDCRKLIIDATSTKERIPILELFEICLFMVDELHRISPRIAVVAVPEAVYEDRFGENVIRNRGLNLMRFVADFQEAVDWLSAPPEL